MAIPHKSAPFEELGKAVDLPARDNAASQAPASGRRRRRR